ncbi:MAG: Ppx/GppA family phosphatase [Hyphomicrobiales bacterium]|nr:Ppx/GppA family phosphatase [Hyphomicrobiales bacterium]
MKGEKTLDAVDEDNHPTGGRTPGRIGIVDMGSNTLRLVVYDTPTRLPFPVFNEKAQCRLAEGLSATGRLSPRGTEEAIRALSRFAHLAEPMGVDHLELVATAAIRDAKDGHDFVERVERTCGLSVHVLSGAEEARLAAIGVLNGIPDANGALADLGGGSLDLVSLDHGEIVEFATTSLGHVRLMEDSSGDRQKARGILAETLQTIPWLDQVGGKTLYCVGGSWRAIARIFIEQTHHPLHVVDNFSIGFFEALRLANLVSGLSRETLGDLHGIDSKRIDSLPFAAAAMAALIERARPRDIMFSAYGMREGQMLEILPPELRNQDPLISACEGQAERTGRFAVHGEEILQWMSPLFADETGRERRLRLAKCLLSDIGWSEHPDYRALHAFHRVLRIPYPGLTHPDRAAMALTILIRYGGAPDDRMVTPVHTLLDEQRLERARVIGLSLRLAHTLSGGAPGLLPQTRLRQTQNTLDLEVAEEATAFVSEAVERRFGRLAKAMKLKGVIKPNSD